MGVELPGPASTAPVLLSQAHVTDLEVEALTRAVTSGWVAPLGPEVDGFEADICAFTGAGHALALSSGTAALHLGLLGLGVKPGDEVIVPTLTFGATAFAVTYTGASPVFVDVEEESWGLDPDILESVLGSRPQRATRPPRSSPSTSSAAPPTTTASCPSPPSTTSPSSSTPPSPSAPPTATAPPGRWATRGIYSFNGNKIMTTSGGGMLVSDDERARREGAVLVHPVPRAVPLVRARGDRLQLPDEQHPRRARPGPAGAAAGDDRPPPGRSARCTPRCSADLEGVVVTPDPPWGTGNSWLTTVTFDRDLRPGASTRVREALQAQNIESRPIWKPMHQQPVFRGQRGAPDGRRGPALRGGAVPAQRGRAQRRRHRARR